MSYHRFPVVIFTLVLAAYFFSTAAHSQNKPPPFKLGVLNIVRLTQESLMRKDIARQIDSRRDKFRVEIKSEEQELRKSNEDLQKQRVILSPAAFEQEIKMFRRKELALQKKVQRRNQEFNRLRVFTSRAFQKELNKALVDVTKKHSFTLVLRRSAVLVAADFFDITNLVLAQIDKNAPSFKIPDVLPQRDK